VVCPRCDRVNDRSPLILGLKFLAVALFVCAVTWVMRVSDNVGRVPAVERGIVQPGAMSAVASQADPRF
jgi:hypothetical protein